MLTVKVLNKAGKVELEFDLVVDDKTIEFGRALDRHEKVKIGKYRAVPYFIAANELEACVRGSLIALLKLMSPVDNYITCDYL